jgi:hypothetical protein
MPEYCKQPQFVSFQRQLNIYEIQQTNHGPNKSGYVHASLIQGIPDLCLLIKHQGAPESKAVKGKKHKRPSHTRMRNVSLLMTTRSSFLFSITSFETLFANSSFLIFFDLQTSLGTFAVNNVEPQMLPRASAKQNQVLYWDEPDFNLFPQSLEPSNLNSSD